MAEVTQRIWRSGPRRVRRTAWGYTLQADGKQVRKFSATWTKEDAQAALAAALVTRETPKAAESVVRTCDQLAAEYLDFKRAKGKRSVGGDELALTRRILPWFGKETPVAEITALRIAQYDRERSAGLSRLK